MRNVQDQIAVAIIGFQRSSKKLINVKLSTCWRAERRTYIPITAVLKTEND